MRPRWLKLAMLAFAALALAQTVSGQPVSVRDKRVALVIGNADYRNIARMKHPANDAADIGAALTRMGFSVTTLTNATTKQMHAALNEFGEKAKQADYAVVFYTGHAIQANGINWLIPIDGSADTPPDVASQAITLDDIVSQLAGVERLGIVLLDVARNNPFSDSKMPPARETPHLAPKNLLIGYSTRAGQKVSDVEGRNSPFTAALLRNIEVPGLDISDLMKRVRDDVVKATAANQIPFFRLAGPDEPSPLMPIDGKD